jgi:hypothetical protein
MGIVGIIFCGWLTIYTIATRCVGRILGKEHPPQLPTGYFYDGQHCKS